MDNQMIAFLEGIGIYGQLGLALGIFVLIEIIFALLDRG